MNIIDISRDALKTEIYPGDPCRMRSASAG